MPSILPDSPGIIHVFELDDGKIEFPQRKAVLNFGNATVETFGLINCIAIGGIFVDKDNNIKGAFMTHESPTDITAQLRNINTIITTINSKGYTIKNMMLFKIEPLGASATKYLFNSKSLSYDDFCDEIALFIEKKYGVKPKIFEYGYYCGRYMKNKTNKRLHLCGKATIDPTKKIISTYSGNTAYGGGNKTKRSSKRSHNARSRRVKPTPYAL